VRHIDILAIDNKHDRVARAGLLVGARASLRPSVQHVSVDIVINFGRYHGSSDLFGIMFDAPDKIDDLEQENYVFFRRVWLQDHCSERRTKPAGQAAMQRSPGSALLALSHPFK
jgi:hypothetical protein